MPPKRSHRPRKARKAPARKTVRKGKAKRKASQNTKVDARLKCTTNYFLQIGNGSNVANYTLGYISALATIPGSGAKPDYASFFNTNDFKAQSSLYDEVCINSYKVMYNPIVTQTNVYDQSFISTTNQAVLQPNLYTWIDRDASALTAVNNSYVNKIAMYDSFKQHSVYKKWTRTVSLKRYWLPTNLASIDYNSSIYTVALTQAGLLGTFGIYGQNLPWGVISGPNESYGQIQVEWSLSFRGKKSLGIAVTDGVVTLTPSEQFAPIEPTILGVDPNDTGGVRRTTDPVTGDVIYVLP